MFNIEEKQEEYFNQIMELIDELEYLGLTVSITEYEVVERATDLANDYFQELAEDKADMLRNELKEEHW